MQQANWHFHCPECDMGAFELGHLTTDDQLLCEVCLDEGRGQIRLVRWLDPDQAACGRVWQRKQRQHASALSARWASESSWMTPLALGSSLTAGITSG